MHALPFSDNSFGGVLLWDYLQTSIAPIIVLREVYRVLSKGGKLLLGLSEERDYPYYYSNLTPRQLTWLLRRAGLETVSMDREAGIYKAEKL